MGVIRTGLLDQEHGSTFNRCEFRDGFTQDSSRTKAEMVRIESDHGIHILRIENDPSMLAAFIL